MDCVKFVPPGGHRACLGCSAAKAKCVFADDGDGADLMGVGVLGFAAGSDGLGPSHADLAGPVDGTPVVPRCSRCERLNRDCLLPSRPRKKRRVGTLKPGTSRSSTAPAQDPAPRSSPAAVSAGGAVGVFGAFPAAGQDVKPSPAPIHAPPLAFSDPGAGAKSVDGRPLFQVEPPSSSSRGKPPNEPGASGGRAGPTRSARVAAPGLPHPYAAQAAQHVAQPGASPAAPSAPPGPSRPSPPEQTGSAHQALIHSVLHMDEREAEELLRFYRDAFSSFNPYMEPPLPTLKAADLRTQKPFIWLTIVFVTSFHDFERQVRLGKAVISYLADQLFQHNVKSLELLQGLLTFMNWFVSQNMVIPQTTNLLHMSMALVTDLGLNKLVFSKTSARSPLDRYLSKTVHGPGFHAPDVGHTIDERRALAGGFCLSHALSSSVIMATPLQYSLQLEDTCRFFEAAYAQSSAAPAPVTAAVTSDFHLAISVRLYYLIARVLQVQSDADLRGGRFLVPVRTHIETFVAELVRLWEGLPAETREDFKVRLLYHTAEIYIYELSLSTSTAPLKHIETPSRDSEDGSSSSSSYSSNGSDMPIRCYMATKRFFDVFLTLPLSLYRQLPVTLFSQLVHADLTLAKLTAYFRGNTQPPGTPAGVRLPSFTDTIEAVASRFQRVRTVPHPLGYTMRNITFDAFAARLRSFKVLDLAGRRKTSRTAAAAAAAAETARSPTPSARAYGSGLPPPPPTSSDVLSIRTLIGSVPEAMNMDTDGPPPPPYASMEESAGHGRADTDSAAAEAATVDRHMADTPDSDSEEQAEWWAWFDGLQTSLLSPGPGSTGAGGGAAMSEAASTDGPLRRLRGPGSVGSIGSLLNNNDQEPYIGSYIRQQRQ